MMFVDEVERMDRIKGLRGWEGSSSRGEFERWKSTTRRSKGKSEVEDTKIAANPNKRLTREK